MIKEIFGKKIGMTQMFSPEGELLPVTLVEVEPACVLEKITYANKERAKIGCFKIKDTKTSKVKKPQKGYFEKIGVPPYKFIKEVEIEKDQLKESVPEEDKQKPKEKELDKDEQKQEKKAPSRYVGIEMFSQGQLLTARAKTKGKGFAGAIKRHKMHKQPSSHGSGMHRRVGSVGASATPSKIAKNKKMPGHLGSSYRVTKNLRILKIDKEKKVIFIRGSIAGSKGTIVKLTKQN
ncbi:MAG: 50S ribosomal protein L3 [Candidatus Omnitrophica bacterium]|nr:50S ribosomal protein L3 [Candidatus Omnitrophota bacterium]